MSTVKLTVNGKAVSAEVEDRTLLVHLLREHLNLTGTHVGCDTSQCGACVVHIDGRAVKSCTVLAGQASGANVTDRVPALCHDQQSLAPVSKADVDARARIRWPGQELEVPVRPVARARRRTSSWMRR